MSARAILVAGMLAVLALCLYAAGAHAHEAWIDGTQVDPQTKRYCCGNNDAFHLEPSQVRVTRDGYKLDTGETIPFERTQPSPDGEFWKFVWGGQVQCFFAPVSAT